MGSVGGAPLLATTAAAWDRAVPIDWMLRRRGQKGAPGGGRCLHGSWTRRKRREWDRWQSKVPSNEPAAAVGADVGAAVAMM